MSRADLHEEKRPARWRPFPAPVWRSMHTGSSARTQTASRCAGPWIDTRPALTMSHVTGRDSGHLRPSHKRRGRLASTAGSRGRRPGLDRLCRDRPGLPPLCLAPARPDTPCSGTGCSRALAVPSFQYHCGCPGLGRVVAERTFGGRATAAFARLEARAKPVPSQRVLYA